jgi:hypothetical protein
MSLGHLSATIRGDRLHRLGHCDAGHQAQQRGLGNRHLGPQDEGAVEINPGRRMPLPAHPPSPGSLTLGDDDFAVDGAARGHFGRGLLRRFQLLEVVHAPSDRPRWAVGLGSAIGIVSHTRYVASACAGES